MLHSRRLQCNHRNCDARAIASMYPRSLRNPEQRERGKKNEARAHRPGGGAAITPETTHTHIVTVLLLLQGRLSYIYNTRDDENAKSRRGVRTRAVGGCRYAGAGRTPSDAIKLGIIGSYRYDCFARSLSLSLLFLVAYSGPILHLRSRMYSPEGGWVCCVPLCRSIYNATACAGAAARVRVQRG